MTGDTDHPIDDALDALDIDTIEKLERLADGTLPKRDLADLERRAMGQPEIARALERLRPLGDERRRVLAEAALRRLETTTTESGPLGRLITFPVRRFMTLLVPAAALAAAGTLLMFTSSTPPPEFQWTEFPERTLDLHDDVRIVLKPEARIERQIEARFCIAQGSRVDEVDASFIERDPNGRLVIEALVEELIKGWSPKIELHAFVERPPDDRLAVSCAQLLAKDAPAPSISATLSVRTPMYAYNFEQSRRGRSLNRDAAGKGIMMPPDGHVRARAVFLPAVKPVTPLYMQAFVERQDGTVRRLSEAPVLNDGKIVVTYGRQDLVAGKRLGLAISPEPLPSLDGLTRLIRKDSLPEMTRVIFTEIHPSN